METLTASRDLDISIPIPEGIDGPLNFNEWLTEANVKLALSFYIKVKATSNDPHQITEAKRFYKKVEYEYEEINVGPSLKLRKIEENLQRINNHLFLSSEGEGEISQRNVDLGDENLNQIMTAILLLSTKIERMENKFDDKFDKFDDKFDKVDEKFDTMERKFNDRFDTVETIFDQRFGKIERQQKSDSSRFGNKYKSAGGDPGSVDAYGPILNLDNKYPSETGLVAINSLSQINNMNRTNIDHYLKFYGLPRSGDLDAKRKRLIHFIGIYIERTTTVGERL